MARRTKEDAEKTRKSIMDAAESVFLENGVSATSLDAVARAAGVTRGAIYWHFRDKSHLLEALVERTQFPVADVIAQLSEGGVTAPPSSVLADIRDACLNALRLLASDPRRQRTYTILLLRCEAVGDVLEWRTRNNREMRKMMIEAFELAERQGELAKPWTPRMAANATSMMMLGMFRDWLEEPKRFDIRTEGSDCVRALFAAMGLREAALAKAREAAG